MKKIGLLFVLVVMIMLLAFTASAASESDLTFELNSDGESYCVSECKSTAEGELIIPDTYNGKSVTKIGFSALSGCRGLISVVIPDSVISIRDYALSGCSGLTSIIIPDSVASIDEGAFRNCTGLISVSLGNGVRFIGCDVFSGCTSLASVVIPDSVSAIDKSAFFNCTNLTSITIPDSITYIGADAFYNTGYYKNQSNWVDKVLYIGNHLIKAMDSVTSCNIRQGTKTIACAAFRDCADLTSIVIPDSVLSIEDGVFYGCTNLISITIPNSVISIGNMAFFDCTSITSIAIPVSLENIERDAFNNTNLKYVFYGGTEEQKKNITIDFNGNDRLFFDAVWHYQSTGHYYSAKTTTVATCGVAGVKTYACSCGDTYTEIIKATGGHIGGTATCTKKAVCTVCKQTYGSLKSHTYATSIAKATLSKDGKVESKCTVCGNVNSSTTINKIKSVKLSATSYTYNNKTKTPSVTVKDSKGNTLKKGTDYTVTYPKKRKSIGKYTVTITFKGNYSGTKKLTFEIVPAKAALSKLTAGSKQLTATWKTVSGATGYEVQYSTSKKFTKKTTKTVTIKKAKTKKTTIKKLSKGKKYFVRVRAYKTVSGKKIYGAYSAVKNVKVK